MVCPLYFLATGFYRGKTEVVVVAVQGAPRLYHKLELEEQGVGHACLLEPG